VFNLALDLTDFSGQAPTCTVENGLTYHVHSFWNNETVSSSANSFCGPSYTGGHYDPSLACSSASEDAKAGCVALGRTADQGYTYPCNSDDFGDGHLAQCEVGDLSGKFGSLKGGSRIYRATVVDNIAPFTANYKAPDELANMWSSVVFHCKDDASRLVCADLVEC
jgi:hypothetical protein